MEITEESAFAIAKAVLLQAKHDYIYGTYRGCNMKRTREKISEWLHDNNLYLAIGGGIDPDVVQKEFERAAKEYEMEKEKEGGTE